MTCPSTHCLPVQLREIRDYKRTALTPGQPPRSEPEEESEEEEEAEEPEGEEEEEEAEVTAAEEEVQSFPAWTQRNHCCCPRSQRTSIQPSQSDTLRSLHPHSAARLRAIHRQHVQV